MPEGKKNSLLVMRAYGVKRLIMWHCCSRLLPLYLVPEYPKSGGTWYSQMLADYLDVYFPRNHTPPQFKKSVFHGHHLYSPAFHNVSVVVRDGRDVVVSAYFHNLFENEHNAPEHVNRMRKQLNFDDLDDIRSNLPDFITYLFTDYAHANRRRFSWAAFINSWWDKDVPIVKYEDLLTDPIPTMKGAIGRLTSEPVDEKRLAATVEKFKFENVTKRKKGEQNKSSFARKGIAGDWKNQFSPEAARVFHSFAGPELIKMGYEADDNWVNTTG